MRTSEQIHEIATALAKAQAAMKPAIKDAINPAFRSTYADLTAVWEACRAPLTSHGIAVLQDVESTVDGIAVTTRLVHSSGQWVECGPLVVPLAKHDAHGVGSATSYAKRYALSAAVGIVSDDDDGTAAVASAVPAKAAVEKPRPVDSRPPAPKPEPLITAAQRRALVTAAQNFGWKNTEVATLLQTRFGCVDSKAIPSAQYAAVMQAIETGGDAEEPA